MFITKMSDIIATYDWRLDDKNTNLMFLSVVIIDSLKKNNNKCMPSFKTFINVIE